LVAAIVYLLCALASAACGFLLYRGFQNRPSRLLFWSTICFIGLAATNLLLVAGAVVAPDSDLTVIRNVLQLLSMGAFIYGLIWDVV
jgi:hypothetical protein